MATSYSYKIIQVFTTNTEGELNNTIYSATILLTALSDDNIRQDYRKTVILGEPDPNNFIPAESVDEATLRSWIEASPNYLTEAEIDMFDYKFSSQREKQLKSTFVFDFVEPDVYLASNFL